MASKATKIQGVDSTTFNLTINQFDEALQTNVQRLSQNIPQVDYSVHFTDGTTVRARYDSNLSRWDISLVRSLTLTSENCIFLTDPENPNSDSYFEYDWEYPALITSPFYSELIVEWIRDNVVVNGVTNQVSVNYIQEGAYRAFTNLGEQLYWIHP
jgi:hypothetical protein